MTQSAAGEATLRKIADLLGNGRAADAEIAAAALLRDTHTTDTPAFPR